MQWQPKVLFLFLRESNNIIAAAMLEITHIVTVCNHIIDATITLNQMVTAD